MATRSARTPGHTPTLPPSTGMGSTLVRLQSLSRARLTSELEKVEQAFVRILGLKPLYFRPPYGSINDLVLQVLGQRGYKSES